MHNEKKMLLGSTYSSVKEITSHSGDPAIYHAAHAVRQKSNGDLSFTKADGQFLGILLGASLSDIKKVSVARSGLKVPIEIEPKRARGLLLVDDYTKLIGDSVDIDGVSFVAQAGAVTPGAATFQAATDNDTTALSLISQVNAHATVSINVLCIAYGPGGMIFAARFGGTEGNDIPFDYTDSDADPGIIVQSENPGFLAEGTYNPDDLINEFEIGTSLYVNDETCRGDLGLVSNATITNGVIASYPMTGVREDGSEFPCILVDMPGGL